MPVNQFKYISKHWFSIAQPFFKQEPDIKLQNKAITNFTTAKVFIEFVFIFEEAHLSDLAKMDKKPKTTYVNQRLANTIVVLLFNCKRIFC